MVISEKLEKLKKSRLSVVLLVLFIAGLYFLQNQAVLPLVEGVVESDLFEANTSDLGTKDRGSLAVLQCNGFARQSIDENHKVEFTDQGIKTWELTAGRYLISSHLIERDDAGNAIQKNYACSVQFTGGDDADAANWSLQGMEIKEI